MTKISKFVIEPPPPARKPRTDEDLLDDIQLLRVEMFTFLDRRIAEIVRDSPGVPAVVIRQEILRDDCLCGAIRKMLTNG